MFIRFILALSGFVLVVATLAVVKGSQIKEMSSVQHVMPAAAVTTSMATAETWQPQIEAIGSLAPIQGVSLSADADGVLVKIHAENGAKVKAGDLIMELDTTVEIAQLNSAEAQLKLAQLQANRANELRSNNGVSQAELDQATAQLNQASANVAALKATTDKKYIRAPFDGNIGIRTVNLGEFIARGRVLVPLQKLDSLYVNFTLPQRQLPSIAAGNTISLHIDAFGTRSFPGKIVAINSQVDNVTRNISAQAVIENPDEILRPGMFARVVVKLPETLPVVAVPATAVSYAAYGNSVFVVEKMKHKDGAEYLGVRQQFVKLGERRGDLIAITDGVKVGEEVATAGVFKLRNAVPVEVNNIVEPSKSATPKPANT